MSSRRAPPRAGRASPVAAGPPAPGAADDGLEQAVRAGEPPATGQAFDDLSRAAGPAEDASEKPCLRFAAGIEDPEDGCRLVARVPLHPGMVTHVPLLDLGAVQGRPLPPAGTALEVPRTASESIAGPAAPR